MRLENAYLSEEELERLILQVEERELVIAPPDLEEKILLCTDFMQEDADGKFALQKERLQEGNSCYDISAKIKIQGIATVSDVNSTKKKTSGSTQRLLTTQDKNAEFRRYCFQVLSSAVATIAIIFGLSSYIEVKPKVEIISRQEVLKASITREEVLNDTKVFSRIFHEIDKMKFSESK